MIELLLFAGYILGLGISGGIYVTIGINDPICKHGEDLLLSLVLWPLVLPIWASWRITMLAIEKVNE